MKLFFFRGIDTSHKPPFTVQPQYNLNYKENLIFFSSKIYFFSEIFSFYKSVTNNFLQRSLFTISIPFIYKE